MSFNSKKTMYNLNILSSTHKIREKFDRLLARNNLKFRQKSRLKKIRHCTSKKPSIIKTPPHINKSIYNSSNRKTNIIDYVSKTNDDNNKTLINYKSHIKSLNKTTPKTITKKDFKYTFEYINHLEYTLQTLYDSHQKALQENDIRNHFMAVMSHELRTPIAAMLGLMELLKTRLKNSENQLLLTNTISSAERLKLHVSDILDFSKIEAQQLQLNISQYNLADELGALLRGFEANAQLKKIKFEVIWSPNPFLIANLDSLRFNQIVTNILSNAIKFTEQGQIIVSIETTHDCLIINVEDTGCGMTQSQIDSIFVPYVQADNTITCRFGGTGLGMSIVANLIKLMNGNITVKSQFGRGTQVKVSLPISIEVCNEFKDQVLAITPRSPYVLWAQELGIQIKGEQYWVEQNSNNIYPDLLFNQLRNLNSSNSSNPQIQAQLYLLQGNILVADDDPINRLLLKKQLSQLGIKSTLVSDGKQAFDKLAKNPKLFDLLITDCYMPNLDGFALARKVKEEIQNFDGAIICSTAEDSRFIAKQAQQSGMNKVLYKPYSLETLRKTLTYYLTEQTVTEQPSSWLDAYEPNERQEMASVVADSLMQDIILLNNPECDIKALAHRIKGAAGALQLTKLTELAQLVEKQNSPHQLMLDKKNLINAMHKVIGQAQQWLDNNQTG